MFGFYAAVAPLRPLAGNDNHIFFLRGNFHTSFYQGSFALPAVCRNVEVRSQDANLHVFCFYVERFSFILSNLEVGFSRKVYTALRPIKPGRKTQLAVGADPNGCSIRKRNLKKFAAGTTSGWNTSRGSSIATLHSIPFTAICPSRLIRRVSETRSSFPPANIIFAPISAGRTSLAYLETSLFT